jgi:hypothetical protein
MITAYPVNVDESIRDILINIHAGEWDRRGKEAHDTG